MARGGRGIGSEWLGQAVGPLMGASSSDELRSAAAVPAMTVDELERDFGDTAAVHNDGRSGRWSAEAA